MGVNIIMNEPDNQHDITSSTDESILVNHPEVIRILRRKFPHHGHFFRALEAYRHYILERTRIVQMADSSDNHEENIIPAHLPEDSPEEDIKASSCFEIDEGNVNIHSVLKATIYLPNKCHTLHSVKGHVIGIQGDDVLIVIFYDDDDDNNIDDQRMIHDDAEVSSSRYYPVLCNTSHIPANLLTTWKSHGSRRCNASAGVHRWDTNVPIKTLKVRRNGIEALMIYDSTPALNFHICNTDMKDSIQSGILYYKQKQSGQHLYRIVNKPYNLPIDLPQVYTFDDNLTLSAARRSTIQRVKQIASITRFVNSNVIKSSDVISSLAMLDQSISNIQPSSYDMCVQFALSGTTTFTESIGKFIPCKVQSYLPPNYRKCLCDTTWLEILPEKLSKQCKNYMNGHKNTK